MKNIAAILLLLLHFSGYGQEMMASGIVSDVSGPLPGASVVVKSTKSSVATDFDGKFEIKVFKSDTLIVSFPGLETVETPIRDKKILSVILKEAAALADVGYPRMSRCKPPIGITTQVPAEQIERNTSDDIENKFNNDVKNNTIKIYLFGGIVSAIREKELAFEKSYDVHFNDFGCVVSGNLIPYEKYNHFVFNYLNQKFGKKWQQEINKNVVGWSSWQNKKE